MAAKKSPKSVRLPKELTTVTPLSKALAVIVFLTVPIIAFFMGMNYQDALKQCNTYDTTFVTPLQQGNSPTTNTMK
jgi:hypothetical protein